MVTSPQESKEIAPITTDVQEPPGGSTTSPPTAGETVPVAVTAESAEAGPSAGPSATAQHINPVVTAVGVSLSLSPPSTSIGFVRIEATLL